MSASSVDSAIEGIRGLIATHALRSGDRLPPERALAAELGVARPTVREAVKRLNESGLLDSRPRSGTYVAQVDLEALADVRSRLEPLAARRAAERATRAEVDSMRATLREMRRERGDAAAFAELDVTLHAQIWRASANSVLIDVLGRLIEPSRLSRSVTSSSGATREGALAQMTTVVAAIGRRDGELAERAMAAHLEQVIGPHQPSASPRRTAAGSSQPS